MGSRCKGYGFEYEVAQAFHEHLGIQFKRALEQVHTYGPGDLVSEEYLPSILEC